MELEVCLYGILSSAIKVSKGNSLFEMIFEIVRLCQKVRDENGRFFLLMITMFDRCRAGEISLDSGPSESMWFA